MAKFRVGEAITSLPHHLFGAVRILLLANNIEPLPLRHNEVASTVSLAKGRLFVS
jgi:hypothetical protein